MDRSVFFGSVNGERPSKQRIMDSPNGLKHAELPGPGLGSDFRCPHAHEIDSGHRRCLRCYCGGYVTACHQEILHSDSAVAKKRTTLMMALSLKNAIFILLRSSGVITLL